MSRFQLRFLFFVIVNVKFAVCLSDNEAIPMLLEETAELRKQLNLVTKTMVELKNENEHLRTQVTNIEKENEESRLSAHKILQMMNPSDPMTKRLLGHEYPQCKCHNNVAFSVSLKTSMTSIGNYQTIKFDNVFTNDNNVYSPMSGVFTAPNNGTYFFTATIMSHQGQYLETEIALNGKSLVYMYSYDTQYEQGTNSVVVTLKTGDTVWVRHQRNEGSNVLGGHWSSFAGFQIN